MVECPGMVVLIAGCRSFQCVGLQTVPACKLDLALLRFASCVLRHVCSWLGKVCVSLDQNWRIQWVCSGKQD